MITWAALGLLATMVDVRAVDAEGVDRVDVEAIVQEAIVSLKRGGHEACWRASSPNQPPIALSATDRCGATSGSDILEISSFGAVSRIRVLLAHTNPAHKKLGESELDMAKDDLTPLRSSLTRMFPPPPLQNAVVVAKVERVAKPAWPFAVGVGGLVATTVGATFLTAGFATRSGINGPGTDPLHVEELEDRRATFAVIGGSLIGLGLGAVIVWAIGSSD